MKILAIKKKHVSFFVRERLLCGFRPYGILFGGEAAVMSGIWDSDDPRITPAPCRAFGRCWRGDEAEERAAIPGL